MNDLQTWLRGKKTYLAAIIGILYLAGAWAGAWEFDQKVLGALGLGGLAFLRAGVQKAAPLLAASGILLLSTGCTTVENATYKGTGAAIYTVDAAMQTWGLAVRAKRTTPDQELQVRHAYQTYQHSVCLLHDYLVEYFEHTAPDTAALDRHLQAVAAAAEALVSLIHHLTGSPSAANPT